MVRWLYARQRTQILIYMRRPLAFGTALRLAEIVGLDVGDVHFPDGRPRARVQTRPDSAKSGRGGDNYPEQF